MAKHSAPAQVSWGHRIGLALLALLLIAGAVGIYQLVTRDDAGTAVTPTGSTGGTDGTGDDPDASGASGDDQVGPTATDGPAGADDGSATPDGTAAVDPADCGAVTVWAAPALAGVAEAAAERAAGSAAQSAGADCFTYDVVTRESGAAQSALRGGEGPDVWLADSTAWPQLLAERDVELEVGETIASTPVLFAGREELVAGLGELGIDQDTTWAGLLEAYQQAGGTSPDAKVQLRLGDPRVDPASMALLSSVGTQLAGAERGTPGSNLMVILAQTSVQGDPLAATDARTIVPATEQQLGAAGDEALRGVPIKDGIGVVRMPFVRMGEAESAPAVDALEAALTSDEAAADLAAAFLRPGTDGEAPTVAGVPEDVPLAGQEAEAGTLAAVAGRWTVIAPQSRILTLIDISGSMEIEAGPDTTRIDLTRAAAQTALSVLPDQTAIGLWYFSTELDGDKDWIEQVPVRALNEEVRSDITQKQVLLAETEKLTVENLADDTGLHDALWAAYQHMQAEASPDSIASIVLLTDGKNDDPPGGLDEDEVIERLTEAREASAADRKVTVVLIGMGEEVEAEALERLAAAAGGQSLVLRDPTELPQVFVDVVASRAP